MAFSIKPRRIFSKEFKLEIVKQIEGGKIRILDVSREYDVNLTSVYNWVNQYSKNLNSLLKIRLGLIANAMGFTFKNVNNSIHFWSTYFRLGH